MPVAVTISLITSSLWTQSSCTISGRKASGSRSFSSSLYSRSRYMAARYVSITRHAKSCPCVMRLPRPLIASKISCRSRDGTSSKSDAAVVLASDVSS
uniref:Putative secreted protein n=1 Tax=Anopheles darlingi TaxID=43151 RepID=A0A2M4D737_ANODA